MAKQYKRIDPDRTVKREKKAIDEQSVFEETEAEKQLSRMQLVTHLWSLIESDKQIRAEIVGL